MKSLCVFGNFLLRFCTFFGHSLHVALFESPKIFNSFSSPFARNKFREKKKKVVLTATLALKSIDSDVHTFVSSLVFNHSSKNVHIFLFLHDRLGNTENYEDLLTHIVFL